MIITTAMICKTVFHFAMGIAPKFLSPLNEATTNSREQIKITATGSASPKPVKPIKALKTRILSAKGSSFFPSSEAWLYFLAI